MYNLLKRLLGDQKPTCGAPRTAILRRRLAIRLPLHFPRFLPFVSFSLVPVRIDSRTAPTGRRS
jgi:hypothetical protein